MMEEEYISISTLNDFFFVRIPYTCIMCIWKRTKDCTMLNHKLVVE